MEAHPSDEAERLADKAAGVEQQLIELVHRREAGDTGPDDGGDVVDFDAAIRALQQELGEIAEQLPDQVDDDAG